MKKVLVYGLKNMWGGLERYLLNMNEQIREEVAMCYLVEQCDCMHQDRIEAWGGEIVYLPSRHPLGTHLKALNRTLKEMRRETDTLYINVNGISFDIAVIVLGVRHGYRVLVHSHNAMMEPIKHPVYRAIHKTLEVLARTLLKFLKVTRLAVSEKAGRYLFGNREYQLVVPGLEVEKFAFDDEKRRTVRDSLGLEKQMLFGFVGRLTAVKNPDFVLQIFQQIRAQSGCEDARLILLGDGPMRQELEETAKDCGLDGAVVFAGEVSDPVPYYQAMDYMLLPSQSEGLSLVAIEAQAAGLPIACSAGRFPDVIRLTELVNFVPLEAGAQGWAQSCIAHGRQFSTARRAEWNKIIFESGFETQKAAQKLQKILMGD